MEDFTPQGYPLYVAWPDSAEDGSSDPDDYVTVGVVVGWTGGRDPFVVLLDSRPDLDLENHKIRLLDAYRDEDRGAIFDTDLERLRKRVAAGWR